MVFCVMIKSDDPCENSGPKKLFYITLWSFENAVFLSKYGIVHL